MIMTGLKLYLGYVIGSLLVGVSVIALFLIAGTATILISDLLNRKKKNGRK